VLPKAIAPDAARDSGNKKTHGLSKATARRYAHPDYWAGFIYTGL
jgi:hypothetical protein